MVVKGRVPRRIERVEQRHARILPYLVERVEHEHGIPRPDAPQLPDDLPRLRPCPGAMVAAHVGGLLHAVARHVRDLAPESLRDALRKRRLAHAGRPDEAENRSPRVTLPAAHGKVFEDALLRFPESEVPCVEDPAGAFEIERFGPAAGPRQVAQTPQVLHRLRVGLVREAVELGFQLRPHRPGHAARVELAAQSGDRVGQLPPGVPELLLQNSSPFARSCSCRGSSPRCTSTR